MSDLGEALEMLARIERLSPRLRDLASAPRELLLAGDRAIRSDLEGQRLPFRVDPPTWAQASHGPAVRADGVLMSSIPTRTVGLRAFYLEAGLSVAVHRAQLLRRSPLLHGSRVAERLRGAGDGVAIPRQHERVRRLRRAWIVEDLLAGQRVRRAEWPEVVDDVVDAVATLWTRADPERVTLRRVAPWIAARRVAELLRSMDAVPSDPDRFSAAVDRLTLDRRPMLLGWTHGDPVPNNVLRLDDGRIGLVDWERARRNPLGLDLGRALAALEHPTRAIERIEARTEYFGAAGTLPLRLQAAVALIGLLPTWANPRAAWHAAGRETGYRVRNARRVRLLEHLLTMHESSGRASEQGVAVAGEGGD
jgi:acyl dehydratase